MGLFFCIFSCINWEDSLKYFLRSDSSLSRTPIFRYWNSEGNLGGPAPIFSMDFILRLYRSLRSFAASLLPKYSFWGIISEILPFWDCLFFGSILIWIVWLE